MSKKIGTGIWFIFFGIVILLHNFEVIHFNFYAMLDYWPLIIISVGINIILQHKARGPMISAVVNLGMCLFLFYIGLTSRSTLKVGLRSKYGSAQDTVGLKDSVKLPFSDDITEASLTFDLGAATLLLDSVPSNDLIRASSPNGTAGLKVDQVSDSTAKHFRLVGVSNGEDNKKNTIQLSLNENPIWNLEFNLGAASFVANLANHKFSRLAINSGATSLTLHLGMPQSDTSVIEINTAASSCKITLPQDAPCKLEHESILSSKKLDGFIKNEDHYKTENFDTATKRYILKINGAANSISINRTN